MDDEIRKELQEERAFLKEDVKDELLEIRSDIMHWNQERKEDVTRACSERRKREDSGATEPVE